MLQNVAKSITKTTGQLSGGFQPAISMHHTHYKCQGAFTHFTIVYHQICVQEFQGNVIICI